MLETDRLLLRPRRGEDAGVVRQLWLERDPRVPAHRRIGPDGRPTVEEVEAALRAERPASPSLGLLSVELRRTGDVVGYCGLVDSPRGADGEPELAFELLRAVWGRGYATEAGLAVVDRARSAGHDRLWAGVWDWNLASRRVLAKLGFTETGVEEVDPAHGTTLVTSLPLGQTP